MREFVTSLPQPIHLGPASGLPSGLASHRFGIADAGPAFELPSGRPERNSARERFCVSEMPVAFGHHRSGRQRVEDALRGQFGQQRPIRRAQLGRFGAVTLRATLLEQRHHLQQLCKRSRRRQREDTGSKEMRGALEISRARLCLTSPLTSRPGHR